MADSLVRTVVHVHEQRFPIFRQRLVVNGIAVILRSDETLRATHALHRLVMRAMTIFQLIGLGTSGTCQQLVTQADTHQWAHRLIIEKCTDMCHRLVALLWVARTISQEQSIELQLVEVVVPRHTNHLDATTYQATDDVGLHATIDEDNFF